MNKELQNSIQYLKDKTGENHGFSVPSDYLDGIEDNFILKLSEDKLPKNTSFETPDAYFDNIENEIFSKLSIEEPKKGKVISLKQRLFKLAPIAVAASLLLFFTFQFLNNNKTITIDDISAMDIENWLEENDSYTSTELAFVYEDNLDENELTLVGVDFSDETIEDYLNSVDHSDLLNEIQ